MYADSDYPICEVFKFGAPISILIVYLLLNPLAIQFIDIKHLLHSLAWIFIILIVPWMNKISQFNVFQFIKFALLQLSFICPI